MKFVATEDIAAPQDRVWAEVTDFDRFEQMVAARARSITRQPPGPVTPSTTWTGKAKIRGRLREVEMKVARLDAPRVMAMTGGTEGMEVDVEAVLAPLDAQRTRLTVTTELRARTLAARLLLQTAKLARKTLAKRFKQGVANFAQRVEGNAGA